MAAAVTLLLSLVALASGGGDVGSGGGAGRPSAPILNALLVLGALAAAVYMVVLMVAYGQVYAGAGAKPPSSARRTLRILLIVSLAVVASLGFQRLVRGDGLGSRFQKPVTTGASRTTTVARPRPPRTPPPIDWLAVGGAFGVGLLGTAVAARYLLRGTKSEPSQREAAEALAAILDDTLDDLRAERDPRRAVIAAYARMERALGLFGLPRRHFEAPLEYLARVLEELQASSASARRLTDLFERAKFSTHEVDPGMKEAAIAALEEVRADLRAPR